MVPRTVNGLTQLHPVAIGTRPHEAPLQETELMNVSNQDIDYKVDERCIKKFNDAHGYGLEILKLDNPSGAIDSHHSVQLRWRFMPLEAKTYEYNFPIKMINGKVRVCEGRNSEPRRRCHNF